LAVAEKGKLTNFEVFGTSPHPLNKNLPEPGFAEKIHTLTNRRCMGTSDFGPVSRERSTGYLPVSKSDHIRLSDRSFLRRNDAEKPNLTSTGGCIEFMSPWNDRCEDNGVG